MKIDKIISGGQTGADAAGLFAGRELGLETGGFAPKGWRTESGPAPWLADFGLKEIHSSRYPDRTKLNVLYSDLTIIFGNHKSPGCKLTINLCKAYEKPYIIVNNFDDIDKVKVYREIVYNNPGSLIVNVAGNREESNPGIFKKTKEFLINVIEVINREAV